MTVPSWVSDSIFYQIFPDRFANGDRGNDPPNVQPWGEKPTLQGFQGGDLQGIIDKLDYLVDLGVTALYLNPIFLSPSNHRYNTTNYYRIDPKLGTMDDFKRLLAAVHERGMRLILDGVFNHCGRGFFAFVDVLENGEHSPYQDWFHIHDFPLQAFSPGDAERYTAWWKFKSLPKFNTDNPEVRRFLFDVARYWIEQGADGWRLDVPNEIDDDSFWDEFRRQVKGVNPDAYLVGEIWEPDPRWVGEGHFDGLMNYPVRSALLELLQGGSPRSFSDRVSELLTLYPEVHNRAHYVPLGSHDTPRIMTLADGEARKVCFAMSFVFCYLGAPAVYYGDEIGLEGGEDPDCRRAFPWQPEHWDHGMRDHVRHLAWRRRENPILTQGSFHAHFASDAARVLSFRRQHNGLSGLLVMNASGEAWQGTIPVGDELGWGTELALVDVLGGPGGSVRDGSLALGLDGYAAAFLVPE